MFCFLLCFSSFLTFAANGIRFEQNPDVGLGIEKLIKKYGYPVEIHETITDDGYYLTMYRIPHGKSGKNPPKKPPILIMHGLLGTAENFVIGGIINMSLAYFLADEGYDVWLGNTRGTYHSRKHRSLNADSDDEFWNFSWHEIGVYDNPAMIDYIISKTNYDKIFYAGHSQGTTSYFVMASERPEYNAKIILGNMLAPSMILRPHLNVLFQFITRFHRFYHRLSYAIHLHEVIPNISAIRAILTFLCQEKDFFGQVCDLIYMVASFFNIEQYDNRILPLIVETAPSSVAIKQILHYAQIIDSGIFRQYDLGVAENLKKYNSRFPPEYKIQNMTAPIALFYGPADMVCTQQGVEQLASKLPNLALAYKIHQRKFGHTDFIFAKEAEKLVYFPMLQIMEKYL